MDISPNNIEIYLLMFLVYIFAGTIKGVIGIGLPTTGMTILTAFLTPLEAIGLNILPMFATNIFQFLKADNLKKVIFSYWKFALIMCLIFLYLSFQISGYSNDLLGVIISFSIILFAVTNVFSKIFSINSKHDSLWQIILGIFSGVIGGFTSMWGVPLTIYLLMKNLKPKEFIDASGFLISIGCIPLSIGFYNTNVFNMSMFWPALVGLLAGLCGFKIGEYFRKFVAPELFRKLVLFIFFMMGLRMFYQSLKSFEIF